MGDVSLEPATSAGQVLGSHTTGPLHHQYLSHTDTGYRAPLSFSSGCWVLKVNFRVKNWVGFEPTTSGLKCRLCTHPAIHPAISPLMTLVTFPGAFILFFQMRYMYTIVYIMHLGGFDVIFLYVELQSVKLNSIQLQKAWDLNRELLAYKSDD